MIAYWPALIHRSRVKAKVLTISTDGSEEFHEINFPIRVQSTAEFADHKTPHERHRKPAKGATKNALLRDIAYARSGDKGDTCNIGVLARTEAIYDWLVDNLTPDVVRKFFAGITFGKVTRFELDNIHALNFLLDQTLDGGGTRSLMIDPQGKTLAQALLQMPIKVPAALLSKRAGKN